MTPQELSVAEARKYLGVKWRHRGRKPWALDCIGLVVFAVRAGGAPIVDRTDYGREPWRDGLQQNIAGQCDGPIREQDWQPGDIVLLRWVGGTEPAHVGMLTDTGIIHAHSQIAVSEHILDAHWRDLIVAVYRPRWPL